MLKIKLKGKEGHLEISEYDLPFPFQQFPFNDNDEVYWSLSSIECHNVKGSFRLSYYNMVDFTIINLHDSVFSDATADHDAIHDGKDAEQREIHQTFIHHEDVNHFRQLLFTKHAFLFFDEKDIFHNESEFLKERQKMPYDMLLNIKQAKASLQFIMEYMYSTQRPHLKHDPLTGVEITIFINLFFGNN